MHIFGVFINTRNSMLAFREIMYMLELQQQDNFVDLIDFKISGSEDSVFLITAYKGNTNIFILDLFSFI